MNWSFVQKFIRYGGSSLIALSADVGTLTILTYLAKFPYLLATGVAFVVGSITKYIVSKTMVYEDHREGKEPLTIVAFILIAVTALLANQGVIYICVEYLGTHLFLAKAFSAGIIFIANFFLIGFFVFKDPLYKESP